MFKAFQWVLLLCCALPVVLHAETLQTPAAAEKPKGFVNPLKGADKAKVTALHGNPKQIIPPVGDPPIERWVYEDFTVYFERSFVIHVVKDDREQTSEKTQ